MERSLQAQVPRQNDTQQQSTTTTSTISPRICLYITGHAWDHYLLFALTEINAGRYPPLDAIVPLAYDVLYANPSGLYVAGEAQKQFADHYQACAVVVGPAWSSQLAAIGEWASLEHKPIVSGGATSPTFAADNYKYVSRSIPSDDQGLLSAFVQLIQEYDIPAINVVIYNDAYGRQIAQGLIDRADASKFRIQQLHTLGAETTNATLDALLQALDDSPTHATFLSMTVLPLQDFLNAAGRFRIGNNNMHERHLWLSPHVTQIVSQLDPPAVGAWGLAYGEELVATDPLAIRYMDKNASRHVALQQEFPTAAWSEEEEEDPSYQELTLWGSYAYDAVLVAAHGLAHVARQGIDPYSDGPALLQAIRNVNITTGSNTGAISLDSTTGDRLGARIPLFYTTANRTSEKFAVYEAGKVSFLQDPLWPDGSRTRPADLFRIEDGQILRGNNNNDNRLFIWITFPIVFVVVLSLVILVYRANTAVRDVRRAPKAPPCCLLFTDIQASSVLWGLVPTEMARAIDTHHVVIRHCLKSHNAYEVKTIGDSFMIACTNPDEALQLALEIQEKLYDAHWNPAIDETYKDMLESTLHDPTVWKGLRVRVSVHYGHPDISMDEVTKGYDYYGAMVNEAARIEGLANGGQTVVSQALIDALADPSPTNVEMSCLGEYTLRGCPGKTRLWNVVSERFRTRQFPPLRSGDAEQIEVNEESQWAEHDFGTSGHFETMSVSTVGINYAEYGQWIKTLFSVLKPPAKRREYMNFFCEAWHVKSEDQLARRISKVEHARKQLHHESVHSGSSRSLGTPCSPQSSLSFTRDDLMSRIGGVGKIPNRRGSLPDLRKSVGELQLEAMTECGNSTIQRLSTGSERFLEQLKEGGSEDSSNNDFSNNDFQQ